MGLAPCVSSVSSFAYPGSMMSRELFCKGAPLLSVDFLKIYICSGS